jgi:hypothetical protein
VLSLLFFARSIDLIVPDAILDELQDAVRPVAS